MVACAILPYTSQKISSLYNPLNSHKKLTQKIQTKMFKLIWSVHSFLFSSSRKMASKSKWSAPSPLPSFVLSSPRTMASKSRPSKANQKSLAKKAAKKFHPFACNMCGRSFPFIGQLEAHYSNQHSKFSKKSKENKGTSCDRCDQYFESKQALKTHDCLKKGQNREHFQQQLIERYRDFKNKEDAEKKGKKK